MLLVHREPIALIARRRKEESSMYHQASRAALRAMTREQTSNSYTALKSQVSMVQTSIFPHQKSRTEGDFDILNFFAFEKVLDEVNPDFLSIMLSTSHSHELLCALCKGRGIKTLMLSTSRLRHGMLISQEGGILDNKNFQNYASKLTPKEQEDYIVNYHASKEMDEYRKSNYENHLADRYISLLKFFFLPKTNSYKNRYANYGRTRKNVLKYKLGHFFRKRYRYFFNCH